MSKPWQLSRWEKRRKEFIKGKSCEWCGSRETLAIHHPQERDSLTEAEYESFEGTMILCKRCHFALHKGMHLCPKCQKKYVPERFEVCFNCLSPGIKKAIESHGKDMEELRSEEIYESRLEYCGNCDHHVEDEGQELFCGLPSTELCDHGLFVEDGVRRRMREA